MSYVDGFVLPVPKKKLPAYRKIAKKAGAIWREHGALEYFEMVGDEMKVPVGIEFPKLTKAKRGEVVMFSYIVYKSKAHRNSVNKKVMADPRMEKLIPDMSKAPFDCSRMAWGGFKLLVKA